MLRITKSLPSIPRFLCCSYYFSEELIAESKYLRIFASCFARDTTFYLLNFPAELQPRKGYDEQNMLPLEHAHTAQASSIGNIRLLQAWQEIWRVCAFLMPISLVLTRPDRKKQL